MHDTISVMDECQRDAPSAEERVDPQAARRVAIGAKSMEAF